MSEWGGAQYVGSLSGLITIVVMPLHTTIMICVYYDEKKAYKSAALCDSISANFMNYR